MRITVVGDVLLDVDVEGTAERLSPDAPVPVVDAHTIVRRAGGAGLVANMLAADGHDVELVTVLAGDDPARHLAASLSGVRIIAGDAASPTPVKTRIRAAGHAVVRLDENCAIGPVPAVTASMLEAIGAADAVIVADYGRGLTGNPWLRDELQLFGLSRPVVWDPHPRGSAPVASTTVVTPNLVEATGAADVAGADVGAAITAAARLHERWCCGAVAVTMGDRGALLHAHAGSCTGPGAAPVMLPAQAVRASDPCGAGDRFSATVVAQLLTGATLAEAVESGVRHAGAFLASGGVGAMAEGGQNAQANAGTVVGADGAASGSGRAGSARVGAADAPALGSATGLAQTKPLPGATSALRLAREVRIAGGTVVATGGCFDLLHAGHARTLVEARRLGDCLVVCLNSDASVRRLKGIDRPLIPLEDRIDLLLALECVDAVLVFDEDTPESAIRRLQPDLWVKGGDYSPEELPEAALLREWGGQTITVPYYPGRSTSRLANALARVG